MHPAHLVTLALPLLGLCSLAAEAVGADEARPGWKLVWADEFAEPGLPDSDRWRYEVGYIRNGEAQFYTKARRENCRIEDGHLILEARKEAIPVPGKPGETTRYTSASIETKGLAEWKYGRIEVRAKMPRGRGNWPAIWMLGSNFRQVGWPACGEIDILEYVGYQPGVVHANLHTKAANHTLGNGIGARIEVANVEDAFHLYAVEWDAERIEIFFDDRPYLTFRNDDYGYDRWPFDQPFFLKLNLAIGGGWGGQRGIDDSIFPQRFLIDYVRVYERAAQE